MIKVVSFKICPFVQRVTALLEAKNVDYEIEYISLKNKPKWFLDVSPNGQVPLLITENNKALFESDAIVEYIEDEYGPLQDNLSNEKKAYERAWSYQASKHYLTQCSTMRSPTKEDLSQRTEKLDSLFEKVEKELSESKYFSGDEIGKVDIAWTPLLHRAKIIEDNACHDFLKNFPKVKKWQKEILNMDFTYKSVAEDFNKIFTDFYLSDKTYLGSGKNCGTDLDNICDSGNCC